MSDDVNLQAVVDGDGEDEMSGLSPAGAVGQGPSQAAGGDVAETDAADAVELDSASADVPALAQDGQRAADADGGVKGAAARTPRTKAIVITSPSNPTGVVWHPETIQALGQWAVEHGIWVIADEIYEHLTYDDARMSYVGALVPQVRDRLVVLNGVAKTYAMTGWRVGWVVAPQDVSRALSTLQGHLTSNVANVSQRAALAAVSGSLEAVHGMRRAFDVRRKAIVRALNSIEGVSCPMPDGAFYALPDVEALLGRPLGTHGSKADSSAELAALLLDEAHVAAVPGEAFGAPGYLRFSYALADDQLAEGMRRFKAWVEA